ncbi:MAG: dipeptide epimerase [Sphingobacteriaceae bacterium]|nr:dipeptide epimerase [Sphingobacteriaceae bacterium]
MRVSFKSFELLLKYPFRISGFARTFTPVMLLEISRDGITGRGEASMVPYMGESVETATRFLSKVDLTWLKHPFNYQEVIHYLDSLEEGNPAVKAAIDIALHDLEGKLQNRPCYSLFNSDPEKMPLTSVTIGIDSAEIIRQKVKEADAARVLKVKLGSEEDKVLIEAIRSVTDKPLYVDANQGWTNKERALDFIYLLKEAGVELIEQPMSKNDPESNAWITERSPLPIIADESVQRLGDLEKIKGAYHGVNIKLMKSAGMHEAWQMIERSRQLNLKILIGCMSETSVATLAATALAPLCDWADIDGPFLTSNNPYNTPEFRDGKWILTARPGLGLEL